MNEIERAIAKVREELRDLESVADRWDSTVQQADSLHRRNIASLEDKIDKLKTELGEVEEKRMDLYLALAELLNATEALQEYTTFPAMSNFGRMARGKWEQALHDGRDACESYTKSMAIERATELTTTGS